MEHESYVSLETAKLLKKAGFDWECDKIYYCYHEDNDTWDLESNNKNHLRILELDYCLLAPTLSVAQKWLREVKGINIVVEGRFSEEETSFFCKLHKIPRPPVVCPVLSPFNTYEEAQKAGIQKCLEEDSITDKCSEE